MPDGLEHPEELGDDDWVHAGDGAHDADDASFELGDDQGAHDPAAEVPVESPDEPAEPDHDLADALRPEDPGAQAWAGDGLDTWLAGDEPSPPADVAVDAVGSLDDTEFDAWLTGALATPPGDGDAGLPPAGTLIEQTLVQRDG